MTDISADRFVRNGMDIAEVFGRKDTETEHIISASVGFMHTCLVDWLNNNGYELAGQELDDAWHAREDQWWRQPDGFDGRYKNGEEKRREIFGETE